MLCMHGQYVPLVHPERPLGHMPLLVMFHAKTPISSLISYCSSSVDLSLWQDCLVTI